MKDSQKLTRGERILLKVMKERKAKKEAQEIKENERTQSIRMKKNPSIVFQVSNLVQKRRKELNISLTDLGELSGVERAYISRLERGMKPGFTFGIVAKLFTALKIKWSELDDLIKESKSTPWNYKKPTRSQRLKAQAFKNVKDRKENKAKEVEKFNSERDYKSLKSIKAKDLTENQKAAIQAYKNVKKI